MVKINDILFALGETLKSLPESVQQDLFGPPAKTTGQALDSLITIISLPLLKAGIVAKAELEKFKSDTRKRLEEIPEQHRDKTKLGLAMKAIEESFYQLSEDDLREMFSKLIASTVDDRVNSFIGPRHATVLSQLRPVEAKLLKVVWSEQEPLLIFGNSQFNVQNGQHVITNLVGQLDDGTIIKGIDRSIPTLKSLGIIEYEREIGFFGSKAESRYKFIKKLQEKEIADQYGKVNDLEFFPSGFRLTIFGSDLLRYCLG